MKLRFEHGATGHAIIEVDSNGQNRIVLYGGTNKTITPEYVDSVLSHFSSEDVIVLQNEINNVPYIIERCHEKGMRIFFNAAPYDEAVRNFPIEKVTWLVVNETEGAALSGEQDYESILRVLKQRYPKTNILFTMGKEGSRILTDTDDIKVEALKVPVVDTTGAGDTYIGYNLREHTELCRKMSVECNVDEDTALPPVLMFHGTKDRTINPRVSVEVYNRLKQCGKDVKLYFLEGADHGGSEFWTEEIQEIIIKFMEEHKASD